MGASPKQDEAQGSSGSFSSEDRVANAKVNAPLIDDTLDRRYAVNWEDNTESDTQYLIREAKTWFKKKKAK